VDDVIHSLVEHVIRGQGCDSDCTSRQAPLARDPLGRLWSRLGELAEPDRLDLVSAGIQDLDHVTGAIGVEACCLDGSPHLSI